MLPGAMNLYLGAFARRLHTAYTLTYTRLRIKGSYMPKRMTVVFDDEELYTELKVAAAHTGRHAKDIVVEAVREWLDTKEDEELRQDLGEARIEWENQGGIETQEFFRLTPPGNES